MRSSSSFLFPLRLPLPLLVLLAVAAAPAVASPIPPRLDHCLHDSVCRATLLATFTPADTTTTGDEAPAAAPAPPPPREPLLTQPQPLTEQDIVEVRLLRHLLHRPTRPTDANTETEGEEDPRHHAIWSMPADGEAASALEDERFDEMRHDRWPGRRGRGRGGDRGPHPPGSFPPCGSHHEHPPTSIRRGGRHYHAGPDRWMVMYATGDHELRTTRADVLVVGIVAFFAVAIILVELLGTIIGTVRSLLRLDEGAICLPEDDRQGPLAPQCGCGLREESLLEKPPVPS